jgi:penicillin-binding protein 1A
MLAGLPKAPSRFNPVVNPERALERRGYVLGRMHELGYITDEQYEHAMAEPDNAGVHGQELAVEAPYVAEMVRTAVLERYGNAAYSAGFEVFTTIDPKLQKAANRALREALLEYDRRHGYRGHLQHVDLWQPEQALADQADWDNLLADYADVGNLSPAVVIRVEDQSAYAYTKDGRLAYLPWEHIEWARRYIDTNHLGPTLEKAADVLSPGDIIYVASGQAGCSWLAQVPTASGAIIALHPKHGGIQALAGGFDYYQSKFNRVIQAERQPGSSFKPFIYTAALDKGYTAASIINDAPVVFDAPGLEDTWRPENYSGQFHGPTRLRQALIHSRNLVSIRLLRDIGIGYAVRYVQRFGFQRNNLPRDLSLALGSLTLTPLKLASAYSVFANGGYRVEPYYIDYIRGPDGNVIDMNEPLEICSDCKNEGQESPANVEPEKAAQDTQAAENASSPAQDEGASADEADEEPEDFAIPAHTLVTPASYAPLLPDLDKDGIATPSLEDQIKAYDYVNEGPHPPRRAPQVLSPQIDFLINTMLRDVVKHGTGRGARRALQRDDLAGKTGTTNEQRDAWFAGFGDSVVTVSWVGFDTPKPLGRSETGARAALPMWIDFMRVAMHGKPPAPLVQPQGIVSVRINKETGEPTSAEDPQAMFDYFLADQVPSSTDNGSSEEPDNPFNPDAGHITEQLF